jgi:hypothetical protein
MNRFLVGTWLAAVILSMLPGALWAQSDQAPLADVARRPPARKATIVLDDETLPSQPPQPLPPPGISSRPGAATTAPDAASKAVPAKSITVKGLLQGASLDQARQLLNDLKKDQQVLLVRYAQIRNRLASEKDDFLRRLYEGSLLKRDQVLAQKQQQIDKLQQAIDSAERAQKDEQN